MRTIYSVCKKYRKTKFGFICFDDGLESSLDSDHPVSSRFFLGSGLKEMNCVTASGKRVNMSYDRFGNIDVYLAEIRDE